RPARRPRGARRRVARPAPVLRRARGGLAVDPRFHPGRCADRAKRAAVPARGPGAAADGVAPAERPGARGDPGLDAGAPAPRGALTAPGPVGTRGPRTGARAANLVQCTNNAPPVRQPRAAVHWWG